VTCSDNCVCSIAVDIIDIVKLRAVDTASVRACLAALRSVVKEILNIQL